MFLNLLSKEEKNGFLDLLYMTAKIDGDYSEKETERIKAYIVEMGINPENSEQNEEELSKVLLNFSKSNETIKKIVILELTALALVDGYKDTEKELIEEILNDFNLSIEYADKALKWLEKMLPIYREGFEIVGLI